jgi:Fe-S oxidoreductase
MEVDGVAKSDYWKVVDHCYLCDLCYMTKCPYVPPHEWNLDFPHLMLRAKAFKFKKGEVKLRDRVLTSTDRVGSLAGIPVVSGIVNAVNKNSLGRKALETVLEVHKEARVPEYHSDTLRKTQRARIGKRATGEAAGPTTGKVALFATCYGNVNEPGVNQDLIAVFEHNGIPVTLARKEQCCGMPKLELGDLESVNAAKEANIPVLLDLVRDGWDIVAPIPSCVLMFKQELRLMYPDDPAVQEVAAHMFDPFEYFIARHKDGLLKTDFKQSLGAVSYHIPCHGRVQNIGRKTEEFLKLTPGIQLTTVERCSGHSGLWGTRKQFHAMAMKIGKPVFKRMAEAKPDFISSDCQLAGHHIEQGIASFKEALDGKAPVNAHPLTLVRIAYGLK